MMASKWLVLDIETRAGRPEDAPRWLRENWWPNMNWTPETIGKAFKKAHEETENRMGLLDTAGIATIQMATETGAYVLHCLREEEVKVGEEKYQVGWHAETEMLIALRTLLNGTCDDGTTLVGWNIKGFDLRRLRFAYLRAGLNIPRALRVSAEVYDMMEEYARHFSVDRCPFVKLEVALEAFGLENHKREFDGSQVDQALRAGEFDRVLKYAWGDLEKERELFEVMTGRSARLK